MLSSADTCTILTTLGEIIYCHMVSINKGMAYLRDTALHCVISRGALCIYFYSRWGWLFFPFSDLFLAILLVLILGIR